MSAPRSVREAPAWRVTYGRGPALRDVLAALCGSEALAEQLLARFGDAQSLARATPDQLQSVRGLGPATVARVKAALALATRLLEPPAPRPVIASPAEAAAVLFPYLTSHTQEALYVLRLDTRNHLIGAPIELYRGSLNTTLIRAAEIFRDAVQANAASILIAHNHPSGQCDPSPEDIAVTKTLVEVGKLLDIELVDHLVLGDPPRFVSLKERGVFGP